MTSRDASIDAWLRDTLGDDRYTREPASADASFRRYLRIRHGGGTWILMDAPPEHEDCGPFLAVQRLLASAGLAVPGVRAAAPELGFVLLEDLGNVRYLDAFDEGGAEELYAAAIGALVEIQRRVPAGTLPDYDTRLVRAELALFPDWLLRRHLGIEPDRALAETLDGAFEHIVGAFAAQPRVFVHRDYHSRNLMVLPGGRPGILDFQDAVRGPVSYDLLSLLRDVYVRWPPERVDAWLERYHAAARTAGVVEVELDAFRHWFELTGAQRHLKVAGIFARLWHRDGKPGYLFDIPLTLRYLRDELRADPALEPLGEALDRLDIAGRVAARNGAVRTATLASQ